MERLVAATHNANKLREFREILPDWDIEGDAPEVEETEATFSGNALVKARACAARHPGAWTLADDSGLCVNALGGAPGVISARYAGRDGDTPANNALLLRNLRGAADRSAYFICAIALISPDGEERVFEGRCDGAIAETPSGDGGFGYDPLFHPDTHPGKSFAELTPAEKNAVSHRGRALALLREFFAMQPQKQLKILVINPGSTSTKVSLFLDEKLLFEESVFHDAPVLLKFPHVNDQTPFRYEVILGILAKHGEDPAGIDVFVGRGGSAYTQPGGVTRIDQRLYDDTVAAVGGSEHPAKLGVMLAWKFSREYGREAFTLNPTNVDEYDDVARLTGIKGIHRVAHSHVLNQKAVAEYHARAMGRRYEDCNFIVAHIDGGITVSAHRRGRMVDGNMGADGEGAFTPTRIGSVPILPLLDYMDAGHTTGDIRLMCSRAGGFVSHFGTADSDAIHRMAEEGDPKASLIWNTMIYQICKQIGEMAAVLCGEVDGILLTGGLLRFDDIASGIRRHCGWIAPISSYPGEMEQEALAFAVLRALRGESPILTYSGKPVWNGFPWE